MPTYTYEDSETGIALDVRRPVADRDKPIVLRRLSKIPATLNVIIVGGTLRPGDEDPLTAGVRKGCRRLEERHGSRFGKHACHDAKTIKKAFGI